MKFAYYVTTLNPIGVPIQVVPVFKRIHRHPVQH